MSNSPFFKFIFLKWLYPIDTEGTSIIDRQAKPQDDIFTEHDGDQNQNGCEATDGICTKDEL